MSGENKTIHCIECNSQELVLCNAICTWNVSEQRWVYSENYDPMYHCADCGMDNIEYIEKEIRDNGKENYGTHV